VAVGRITSAHGVKGEVSVLVLTEIEGRFASGSSLRLEDGRSLTVDAVRPNRGRLLVAFEGVPDRTAAEALAGQYLFVPASDVPPAPKGAFWPHQLVGCEVVTEGGRALGELREVVPGQANDLWIAAGPEDKETLIPALAEVVLSVDLEARRVVVREIPGLTAPESD